MIFIDPTETTTQSKLPEAVVRAGVVLSGLERMTGADFLISPLSSPTLKKASPAPIHKIALQKHTQTGLLVQRKDGNDLLSSINKLTSILARMLEWAGLLPPWLLVVGEFEKSKQGKVIANGRASKWNWSSYVGALDSWQLKGGGLTILPRESDVPGWVNDWHNSRLSKTIDDPDRLVNKSPVSVTLSDEWWSFLAVLPGIGPKKARVLADWLPVSFQRPAWALEYLSDLSNLKYERPKGFGRGTFETIHKFLMLQPDEMLQVVKRKDDSK